MTIETRLDERRSVWGRKNAATAEWTEDRIELLTKLWADGLTCSQIAVELGGGATRNSVIGKVTRLKLPPRLSRSPYANTAKRAPGVKSMRAVVRGPRLPAAPRRPKEPKAPAPQQPRLPREIVDMTPAPDAPLPLGLSLVELTAHTCKWPIGDPREPGFGFCGHEPVEGKPYCPYHHGRSIRRSTGAFVPGSVAEVV